ncbi:MAG: NgoFVII family restriction endonuclease, partial [Alphaproteobacteria bacterium]|nr:NgoFVII family restriction endonuclease [Alphaproteobacteria bacterium]
MPQILDNIASPLSDALKKDFASAHQADFCVGYFNLRGWRVIADAVTDWDEGKSCRLLVGMNHNIEWDVQNFYRYGDAASKAYLRPEREAFGERRDRAIAAFGRQLVFGHPTRETEKTLRVLRDQLAAGKVRVKLFLRYPLHAKLYLLHFASGVVGHYGIVGSSNLTLAGLCNQGELNIDVTDGDATQKLATWFDSRWQDKYSIDISQILIDLIDGSWLTLRKPYDVYMRIVYFLSQQQVSIPAAPRGLPQLFDFQEVAVRRTLNILTSWRGAVIGDVVGLGKTWIACSVVNRLALIDGNARTVVVCPARLQEMWREEVTRFQIDANVVSMSQLKKLPRQFSPDVVIVDECHNFRNHTSERYKLLHRYLSVEYPTAKVLLLSATLYSKQEKDIYNQLQLFLDPAQHLGREPVHHMQEFGLSAADFVRKIGAPPSSLQAFGSSSHPSDWQSLLELFLVRRTRAHIAAYYAHEEADGTRYLQYPDGRKAPFPTRQPRTKKFAFDPANPADVYAQLLNDRMVDAINSLTLARYALHDYIATDSSPSAAEEEIIADLSRAQGRLRGFTRTNFLKRLESSGEAFRRTLRRFLQRNCVFIYAIDSGLSFPVGKVDPSLLQSFDVVEEADSEFADDDDAIGDVAFLDYDGTDTAEVYLRRASEVYALYQEKYKGGATSPVRWLSTAHFLPELRKALMEDCHIIEGCLQRTATWSPAQDNKYAELLEIVQTTHADDKILVFSQFADTIHSLHRYFVACRVGRVAAVTGSSDNIQSVVQRFSPRSNPRNEQNEEAKPVSRSDTIRVLLTTDSLSEGQNLQDAHIVVNFDLPWTVIRLIQRAGRVDRLGQESPVIHCYSFVPGEDIEEMLQLRARVIDRLQRNREIIGTDEVFFPEVERAKTLAIYAGTPGALDGDGDTVEEVDPFTLASDIWAKAVAADPELPKTIETMPEQARTVWRSPTATQGGMVGYYHLPDAPERGVFMMVDTNGKLVSKSTLELLEAIAVTPKAMKSLPSTQHFEMIDALDHGSNAMQQSAMVGFTSPLARGLHSKLGEAIAKLLANTGSDV